MDMDLDLDPDRDAAVSRRPLPLFAGAAAVPAPPPLVLSGAGAPPPTLTAPAAPAPARAEPRRRNRPALSCIQCRTRKIRCDRHEPCSSCIKSKIVNCTYEEGRRPKPRLWRLSPAPADAPPERSPTGERQLSIGFGYTFREMDAPSPPQPPHPAYSVSAATAPGRFPEPASTPSPMTQADLGETSSAGLAERVRQLEHQLADALARPDRGPPPSRPARAALCPDRSALSIVPGTALLTDGDKLFPLVADITKRIQSNELPDITARLQKCKHLGSRILSARMHTHMPLPIGKTVPAEETARRLVDAYFRTFESVYRILHQPSFWHAYRKYWDNPDAADPAFVVRFQLCMAIGTCFQDDVVALRRLAAQWISEAQLWLASPAESPHVSLSRLQTLCLLHLARETCGVSGDMAWLSAGFLLRTAMSLGLHRDPDKLPTMSVFGAEMRRRLWGTVLEIVLQSSLDCGAPPLLSLSDFDTRPPSNYDDDQLAENETDHPSGPRPPSTFTQTTVQLALLRSVPVRLAIAQYVNHFNSPTSFHKTLEWNTELTNACRALSTTFQPLYDPAGILPKRLSLFQLRLAEHMVHRFFLALNHPWLWSAHNNPTYYFARKMCVETSLKLYRAIATGSPAGDSGTASPSDDFTRLATCGNGAFRSVPTLAVLTICLELLWQVQEERSFRQGSVADQQPAAAPPLPPPPERPGLPGNQPPPPPADVSAALGMGIASGVAPRQELLEAVRYSIGWAERRIRSGEANVKGYLLFSALLCQAQALQRGGGPEAEVAHQVLGTLAEGLGHCYRLLQDVAGGGGCETGGGGGGGGGAGAGAGSSPNGSGGGGHAGAGAASEENGATAAGAAAASKSEWDSDAVRNHGFTSVFNLPDADFFIGS